MKPLIGTILPAMTELPNKLTVAIVGAGPAGLYAADHLLEAPGVDVQIDIIDRLPTPTGLVRSGVAPDHQEKKLVGPRLFEIVLRSPNVRYYGNITVGEQVSHEQLTEHYDAVIYAVGSQSARKLNIPGEDLPGVFTARDFVLWYNGHPDYTDLKVDLSHSRAVIIGNGNVALDVARILTLPVSVLEKTDIADHALQALRTSAIREIEILGRRGAAVAACNNPELEELEGLAGTDVIIDPKDALSEEEIEQGAFDWWTKRKLRTMSKFASQREFKEERKIKFRFMTSPVAMNGTDHLESVDVVDTQNTTNVSKIDAGLAICATGFRGVPLSGLPFDEGSAVIENEAGRIMKNGAHLDKAYVTGWIKRGPRGVIGTNKKCAEETVRNLLADVNRDGQSKACFQPDERESFLRSLAPNATSLQDWHNIDRAEINAGAPLGRLRVKLTRIDDMLNHIAS